MASVNRLVNRSEIAMAEPTPASNFTALLRGKEQGSLGCETRTLVDNQYLLMSTHTYRSPASHEDTKHDAAAA